MRTAILNFTGALLLLALAATAIAFTSDEGWLTAWFLLFIFLGLPLLTLTTVDLGHALRSRPNPSRVTLLLGFLLAVPQALFAALTTAIGLAIIGWVLYNTFIHRQPEYTGGFLTFGLGPVMVLFGVGWLKQSFSRDSKHNEPGA